MNAQSIAGKWTRTEEETQDDLRISLCETMSLKEGGQLNEKAVMNIYIKDDKSSKELLFRIQVSFNGQWQYSGDVLTSTIDAKSLKTEVLEAPDDFPKMLTGMFSKMASSEFKKEAKKQSHGQVTSLTADKLVVKDLDDKDGDVTTYTRN